MGFDATLGFVVNLGAPQSPVAYYQQVGRAGRGTDEATVVLLPALEDRDIWAYFASLAFPPEPVVRQTLATLAEVGAETGRPVSTPALEARVELNRTRLEQMLKVLDVDGAVRRVQGGWEATGADWTYDEERYAALAAARKREQDAMLAYLDTDSCRMWFLRDQLDDEANWDLEAGERCGRCDNCGGLTLGAEVSEDSVAAAAQRLSRPGVPIEPRKLWPQALSALGVSLTGKIAERPSQGRAVARLTDLGYGQQLRDLFRVDGDGRVVDGPVPDGLARAMVSVLADWRPGVDAIVSIESARRPTLVGDLADGLSRYLRVPVVAHFAIVDPDVRPGQGAMNSAQRVAAVSRRFALDAPVSGRILLVDDLVGTGWTLTLAVES
jgi:ATP-dependent DNA helicase RecQ